MRFLNSSECHVCDSGGEYGRWCLAVVRPCGLGGP